MAQRMIPCFFMRGGTSRGTYFLKDHLPNDRETLNRVLLEVMGSPDERQIDGLGGATTVTSKVAILSESKEMGVDVDFHFAQVGVTEAVVDWEPSCGNILAGVGPAAIEMGLVKVVDELETRVRIRAVNNGSFVEAVVQTPGGQVMYEGEASIDGVPGTAAPITLNFKDIVGSKTGGKLLPTGRLRDVINGVEVTCIDCGMPIVIARASAMGKTGYETRAELDADADFFIRLEAIRQTAGKMMGLGDVSRSVIPKFAVVAAPSEGGKAKGTSITARYFVPTSTHASMAVTGGISISCCSLLTGTVMDDISVKTMTGDYKSIHRVVIEHPSGTIQFLLDAEEVDRDSGFMEVRSAGVLRTARLLFTGLVRVRNELVVENHGEFHEMHEAFRQLYQVSNNKHSWSRRVQLQKRDSKILPRVSSMSLSPAGLPHRLLHLRAAKPLPFHAVAISKPVCIIHNIITK